MTNVLYLEFALLRACAEFCNLQRQMHEVHDRLSGSDLEAAADDLGDRQEVQLDQIIRLRATTAAGHRARATALWDYLDPSEHEAEEVASWDRRLMVALVRDLVGAGDPDRPPPAVA